MRNRLLLTVASLLGAAASAHAQQFAPSPIDPTPIGSATPAPLPAAIGPISATSARTPAALAQATHSDPVVAYGQGCSATVAPTRGRSHARAGKLFIGGGTVNPVACGCLASERSFAFGSCRQFFNPLNDCGGGCGSGGCWDVDRRPPGLGVTSYLNR